MADGGRVAEPLPECKTPANVGPAWLRGVRGYHATHNLVHNGIELWASNLLEPPPLFKKNTHNVIWNSPVLGTSRGPSGWHSGIGRVPPPRGEVGLPMPHDALLPLGISLLPSQEIKA